MKTYSIGDTVKIITGRLKGCIGKIESINYLDEPINGNTYYFRVKVGLLKLNDELDYTYDNAAEGDMEMYLRKNEYMYNKAFISTKDEKYVYDYEANNKFKIIEAYNCIDCASKRIVVEISDEAGNMFNNTYPLNWFYIPVEPSTIHNINDDDFLI